MARETPPPFGLHGKCHFEFPFCFFEPFPQQHFKSEPLVHDVFVRKALKKLVKLRKYA